MTERRGGSRGDLGRRMQAQEPAGTPQLGHAGWAKTWLQRLMGLGRLLRGTPLLSIENGGMGLKIPCL